MSFGYQVLGFGSGQPKQPYDMVWLAVAGGGGTSQASGATGASGGGGAGGWWSETILLIQAQI